MRPVRLLKIKVPPLAAEREEEMGQISVVYWSGTGNTAQMAEYVAEGIREAGKEAAVLSVDLAGADTLKGEKAFALGCPSMGAEQLEESVMEPFMCELDGMISGKKVALFGSYGWGGGEWMREWEERISNDGASVLGGEGVIAIGAPDAEAEEACKALGRALAAAAE